MYKINEESPIDKARMTGQTFSVPKFTGTVLEIIIKNGVVQFCITEQVT
jgi:hypothetical protein